MRPDWLNWRASRRDAGSAGRKARRVRTFVQGGLASVRAVAGLVVFATEASAHNNIFQSVSATCNSAPTFGAGATVTWTLYNDWNQSETGTFSTSQGTLSTTTLSIAASPTQNATPPAATSQTFTQTLSAADLAALSPSSTISVSWSATWTDSTPRTGTLTTTLAALELPSNCSTAKTTPTIATTLVPPSSPMLSLSWGDSATVTGSPGAAPAGSVSFHVCQASASPSSSSTCATGGSLVGTVGSPSTSSGNASTYNLGTPYTPPSVGTFCFYAVYTPTASESYLTASGPAECFGVNPAYPGIKTTLVTPASPTLGNSWSDTATVNGVFGGGAPLGSVSFYVCQASPSPSSTSTCTHTDGTGSLVGAVTSPSSTTNVSATYNLSPTTFTPTSAGTYCFYTLYTPSTDNYNPVWGPTECFGVSAAGTVTTTHTSAGVIVVGGTAFDTATVTGDASHGVPTGTVTFFSCAATSSAGCTGGTEIPGTTGAPNPAPLSSSGAFTSTATSPSITPSSPGTYCFGAVYTSDASKYTGSSDNMGDTVVSNECFTVGAATSSITTQQSTSASGSGSVNMGGTVTDSATVTGNGTGGAPGGTVTFTVCGPMAGNATCSGGSPVGSSPATLTPVASSDTSTASSVSFMPTAVGTYCFAAVYNPAPGSSYVTSNDDVSGTVQASECFSVTAPNFTVVKTDVPTSGTSVAPGSTIAYTVAVKNVGDGAGSATVTDAVPSSLTVKGTPACAVTTPDTCSVINPSGSTWTFTVSLAAGDSATVTFSATVASSATGSITNTATITTGPCTTAAGCSSTVTNPIITTAAAVVTPSSTPTTPATTTTTTPPTTSPATIAFTGAMLSQEWMAGLAALILGSGLVLLARWRRRNPGHAASKK
jgi:hypothetical protein